MSDIERLKAEILEVFDQEGTRKATAAHLIDKLDRREVTFNLQEFDKALTQLEADDEIRIKNPRAPIYEKLVFSK